MYAQLQKDESDITRSGVTCKAPCQLRFLCRPGEILPRIIPFNFSKGSFSIVVSSALDLWSGGEQQFIYSFSIFEASGRVPAHKKDWLNLLGIQRGAMVDPELELQPSSFSAFPHHSLACS